MPRSPDRPAVISSMTWPRLTCEMGMSAAMRVSSPAAFRDALPKAVNEALGRYLKTTDVHPPQTPPSMSRPTLRDQEF